LARRGFTSAVDGLGGPQGFVPAHHPQHDSSEAILPDGSKTSFMFADVRHKLHACCHGTHAMIEGLRNLLEAHDINHQNLAGLTIRVNPRWLKVCDIKAPRTGLEVKFSFVFLAAMVLHHIDTAAYQSYDDSICGDAGLITTARKIAVIGDEAISDGAVNISTKTQAGAHHTTDFDLMDSIDLAVLGSRLVAKAAVLIGASRAEKIWESMDDLDSKRAAQMAYYMQA